MNADPAVVAALITGLALLLLPWPGIAWGRRLARRAPHETPISRSAWRLCILPLVPMGAYLLVGNYVMKWGWRTTLWFLGAPFVMGLWRGWPRSSPPAVRRSG